MEKTFSELKLKSYYQNYETNRHLNIIYIENANHWVHWMYLQVRYNDSMHTFMRALDEYKDEALASDESTILHAIAASMLSCKLERMEIVLHRYPNLIRQPDILGRTPVFYTRVGTDFLLSRMEPQDDEHRDHSGFTAIQFRASRKNNCCNLVEWATKFPNNISFILNVCISKQIYDYVEALIPQLIYPDEILRANLAIGFCIGIPKNPLCEPYFVKAAEIRPELHQIFFSDNYKVFLDWCRNEYFSNLLSYTKFLLQLIEREDDFFWLRLEAFSEIFDYILRTERSNIVYFFYVLDENVNRYLPSLPEARIQKLTHFILNEDLDQYFTVAEINFVHFINYWLFIYKINVSEDTSVNFFRFDRVHGIDEKGQNILHYACSEKIEAYNKRQQLFTNVDMVRWCLQLGNFDINQRNVFGKTPLHLASWRNFMPDVVELLKASGACDDLPDTKGRKVMDENPRDTPLDLQCLTSKYIMEKKINFDNIPEKIKSFVQLHGMPTWGINSSDDESDL